MANVPRFVKIIGGLTLLLIIIAYFVVRYQSRPQFWPISSIPDEVLKEMSLPNCGGTGPLTGKLNFDREMTLSNTTGIIDSAAAGLAGLEAEIERMYSFEVIDTSTISEGYEPSAAAGTSVIFPYTLVGKWKTIKATNLESYDQDVEFRYFVPERMIPGESRPQQCHTNSDVLPVTSPDDVQSQGDDSSVLLGSESSGEVSTSPTSVGSINDNGSEVVSTATENAILENPNPVLHSGLVNCGPIPAGKTLTIEPGTYVIGDISVDGVPRFDAGGTIQQGTIAYFMRSASVFAEWGAGCYVGSLSELENIILQQFVDGCGSSCERVRVLELGQDGIDVERHYIAGE